MSEWAKTEESYSTRLSLCWDLEAGIVPSHPVEFTDEEIVNLLRQECPKYANLKFTKTQLTAIQDWKSKHLAVQQDRDHFWKNQELVDATSRALNLLHKDDSRGVINDLNISIYWFE